MPPARSAACFVRCRRLLGLLTVLALVSHWSACLLNVVTLLQPQTYSWIHLAESGLTGVQNSAWSRYTIALNMAVRSPRACEVGVVRAIVLL